MFRTIASRGPTLRAEAHVLQRLYEAIAWRMDRLPEHPLADAVVATWSYRERRDRDALIGWLNVNYYREYREPNYRSLQPKIIVEELLHENGQRIPRDYKTFCFHGVPCFVMVNEGRFSTLHKTLYSPQWELLPFRLDCPQHDIPRPPNLGRDARRVASTAAGLSFVRVDMFSPGDGLRVGELTNFPDACGVPFDTPDTDEAAGRFFDEPHLPAQRVFGRQAGLRAEGRAD